MWSIGIIVLVVVGIGVLVLAKQSKSKTAAPASNSTEVKPAPSSIATDLAAVPMTAIAAATAKVPSSNPPKPTKSTKRLSKGKPEVLYVGAEFCPYCAGERWPLTIALSKFGTFSGLQTMYSSESNVPTLSFHGAKYSSDYVSFRSVELQDQNHKPLETGTPAELALFQNLGGGSFPFIDFGGLMYQSGGSVDTQTLLMPARTPAQVASTLAGSTAADTDGTSLKGSVNSVAGGFIQQICALTDDKPAKVCKAIPSS